MKHIGWRFWFADWRFLEPGIHYFNGRKARRVLPLPRTPAPPACVEFHEQTVVIAKDQPQYNPLPAYRFKDDVEGRIICCWKLSVRDRLRVLFRGVIWHQVLTFNGPLQPQLITVEKPEMPKQ